MSSSNSLIDIKSADALKGGNKSKAVLLFGADWHEACPMLKMVLGALAQSNTNSSTGDVLFGNIDAENVSDLSDQYEVTMVPTIILLLNNKVWERLEGEVLSDPSHVTLAVQRLFQAQAQDGGTASSAVSTSADDSQTNTDNDNDNDNDNHDPKQAALNDRLGRLVRGDTVMLFMKGNPNKPRCGFSRQAIEILNEQEVPFGSFDILSDEDVRQGLKVYSDWPTFPQIVCKTNHDDGRRRRRRYFLC